MKIERRKTFRHPVPNDMFYILSNDSAIKGWIKDINEGGMAFVYLSYENYKPIQKMKFILAGNKLPFYLPDIPCKIIYDIKINNSDRPFNGVRTRCCGVQYGKLDTNMKEKLAELLSSEVIRSGI